MNICKFVQYKYTLTFSIYEKCESIVILDSDGGSTKSAYNDRGALARALHRACDRYLKKIQYKFNRQINTNNSKHLIKITR